MTWTNLNFNFGQTLTAAEMLQIQDNFEAIAENHSGAPQFEGESIDDGALRTSHLTGTGVGSASGIIPITSAVNITMNQYSFFPRISRASGSGTINVIFADSSAGAGIGRLALRNPSGSSSVNYQINWRYMT